MSESISLKAILSASADGFSSVMKNAQRDLSDFADKIKGGFAFGVLSGAGQQAFGAISNGVKGLIGDINKSNVSWKTFAGNMEIMGKGKGEIEAVKEEMQSFAEASIYNSSDMASTYAQLAAVGTKNTTELVKGLGGLAAAAEDPKQAMRTLSQQATQMAAKPKVAWEDYKLLLDQTPAGMAAVAKKMGMSTQEMVTSVQDGKISTNEFFDAIQKVGTSDSFTKLATEYKDAGQAMGGLTETLGNKLGPAFEVLSTKAIRGIEGIIGKISQIDGKALAAKVTAGIEAAKPYLESLSKSATRVGAAFGKAFSAIGKTFSTLGNSVGKAFARLGKSMGATDGFSTFEKILDKVTGALERCAGFIEKNADGFMKIAPCVLGAVAAFKGFQFLKSFNPFGLFKKNAEAAAAGASGAIGKSKSTIAQVIGSLGGVLKNAGSAIKDTFIGIGATVKGVGAGIKTVLQGVAPAAKGVGAGLQSAFKGIGAALKVANPVSILATGAAIGIVVAALALLATQGEGITPLLQSIGTIIGTIVSAVITSLAEALVILAPLLPSIAQSLVMLSPLVGAFGTAISAVAVAVGEAVSNIVTAVTPIVEIIGGIFTQVAQIVADAIVQIVTAVAPMLPAITDAFTSITSTISGAIVQIVEAVAPYMPEMQKMVEATTRAIQAICSAFTNLVSQIAPIIQSITELIKQLGETISGILRGISDVIATVGNSIARVIDSIGGAISGVIDSVAGVFESLGNAALNAGKGFEAMARGIKTITELNLIDMAASLGAVALGIGGILLASAGLPEVGAGMAQLATGLLSISANGTAAAASMTGITGAAAELVTSLTALPVALMNAGTALLTFAAGAATAGAGLLVLTVGAAAGVVGVTAFGIAMAAACLGTLAMSAALLTVGAGMGGISTKAKSVENSLNSMKASVDIVEAGLNALGNIAKGAMDTICKAFTKTAVEAKRSGTDVGEGFTRGMQGELAKAPTIATMTVEMVIEALSAGQNGAYSAGAYISQGFAQGMLSCLGTIRSAAEQMAEAADEAVRAKARIHSPSKVSDKLGGYWGQGYVGGLLGMVKKARKAAEKLVSIPTIAPPALSVAYEGGIAEEYDYYRNSEYTIVVPLTVDGREIARSTVGYTQDELNKRQGRDGRKHGRA